ncbi:hypothetical protein AB0G79_06625 [Streptomyces sp. NPDC020807]|uniref:hypothetical protein n=1 Tax=Streptomyces sp. NPDC020807 TaxID=3155119 RepID=UPI0033C9A530
MPKDTPDAPPHRLRRRLLARVLGPLLAALALLLVPLPGLGSGGAAGIGPGAGTAEAASVCQGRPARTYTFATGELRLYRTRHYACATTVAKGPAARRPMTVSLQPRGGRAAVRSGKFTRQAGPVTVHALNRCVRAYGSVSGKGKSTVWILC